MQYKNLSESGIVTRGFGTLGKITVNSHSSGTLKIFDATEAGVQASTVLTSAGACVPAYHGQNVLTSTGAYVPGTHAVSVFTSSGVVVDGEIITIGTTVYRAKAIPSQPYDVAMGANAEAFLSNLYNAINGFGTGFYVGTAKHPSVVAVAKDATTITVRGRVPGTSLNNVATTTDFANGSWADTTLGGGTGASDAGVTTAAATVTIGAITYTFVDALSETYGADAIPYQVLAGANVAASLDNLKKAINGTGTAGTEYSTGTVAHEYVIATTNTDTAQTIRARAVGDAAYTAVINALAQTETLANTSWADSTMGGGTGDANPSVTSDNALITIGDITYTAVLELSETSGATAVPYQVLWVTNEATFLDNLKLAVNASGIAGTQYSTGTLEHPQVYATTNTNTEQTFVSKTTGTGGNSIATTDTLANYTFTSTAMASGTGTNGRLICDTITLATGERVIDMGDITFSNGLYITIGGTSANITVSYK